MPTYNRREFVPHAIRYFLRQDYENKELIVVDDGEDSIQDLIPDIEIIRYYRLDRKITLGAKLNLACEYASGTIIANWDDDDWYAPGRLTYQTNALESADIDVCGINKLLYYDLRRHVAYRYVYPPDQRIWLLGSSLCFQKQTWQCNGFADINVGMDGLFVWKIPPHRVRALPDSTMSVHMIHNTNISPKQTHESWWHAYPVEQIKSIMGADWNLYNNDKQDTPNANAGVKQTFRYPEKVDVAKPVRNIYACLVHENENCIIDLVRNLNYHHPDSTILLYNGSERADLLHSRFPFTKYGAVVHPKPMPLKHGYLHHFALACMQFALDNFAFDCLTIVDSDQLGLRSGYPSYLGQYLSSQSNVGMLSSDAQKINRGNNVNHVAAQAFNEYDLWKPLLDSFPDGHNKFVYWTFWPSTVFTSAAATDLTKLFATNKLLQDIMGRSKIWASEEVILPTLVSLLGYEIVSNPCSYDYVNYRKVYTLHDLDKAFERKDAFWVHPVIRKYNDPLRAYIRNKFNNYSGEKKWREVPGIESFSRQPVINEIKQVEGWLSAQEADLLITSTVNCLTNLPPPHAIVEIGSYHGKSTILFGRVVNHFFPGSKIYAIDPHDGTLGAADQTPQLVPPSYESFKRNIENAMLSEVIEAIKTVSTEVVLKIPISLLFIDGLHDYANVKKDFSQFSESLCTEGYAVFHDYAGYFPGVIRFVDELLATRKYRMAARAESLIVLQKLEN